MVCSNVHGIIGVVNIQNHNYLVIATDSYKTCTVPAFISKADYETNIHALTKVELIPFQSMMHRDSTKFKTDKIKDIKEGIEKYLTRDFYFSIG
jgi:predicted transcriptional regulator